MIEQDYYTLARKIMLSGMKREELEKAWDYRKNKTFDDVRKAVKKGKKKGLGKFENEEFEIAWNLYKVLLIKPKAIESA